MTSSGADWVVVVPFKGAPHGKSRLASPVPGGVAGFDVGQRAALAFAFLRDTVAVVAAAVSVRRVLVVSASSEVDAFAAEFSPVGFSPVEVVADPGAGLNAAVTAGIAAARQRFPGAHVAAMTGDLPALRLSDLCEALVLAEGSPLGVCADRSGEGTTVVTAAPGVDVVPQFGVGSFARHVSRGHVPITVPLDSTIRFDIDSADDLEIARAAGLAFGVSTASALFAIGR